jgi:hypothetical protein
MRYLVYITLQYEVEASSEDQAKGQALDEYEADIAPYIYETRAEPQSAE